MSATRKTHIVRVFDDSSGTKDKDVFVDIEVLDAIAFRTENNREVILSLPAASADPVIKDDVGVGAEKTPSNGTRLSHMKKVASKDGKSFFAAEVLDCVAFRDANNTEWILQMPADDAAPFNSTTGTGAGDKSTRRVHTEKLSATPGEKDPTDYISVERCDEMAFRSFNGQELVIQMSSADDGSTPGRAESVTTPDGYDGTDDGATPPENADPNVYFKFMKGSGGVFLNKDDKVAMGPLWWLRRASGGEILVFQIDIARLNMPAPTSEIGGGQDETGGLKFKLTSSFGFNSDNIEGDLTVDDPDIKVMPKTATDSTLPIKLSVDEVWWTHQPNDAKSANFTTLLFLNVAKIKKDSGKTSIDLKIETPRLQKANDTPTSGVGHYVWIFGSDFTNVYIPVHPAPDASNAFGPYPFDDFGTPSSLPTYLSLADYQRPGQTVTNINELDSFTRNVFDHIGFTPTDFPGSNGAYGFNTAGGAAAWAAARTAGVQATNEGKTIDYGAISIDFGDPNHPQPNVPTATVTVTAMDFIGKTTFNYDVNNQPLFAAPASPSKKFTQGFGHAANFNGSFITFTLHADKTMSAVEDAF